MHVHNFFLNDTATTEIYTLSLHDALPILPSRARQERRADRLSLGANPQARDARLGSRTAGDGHGLRAQVSVGRPLRPRSRSEEHTSELQSQFHLVCRLLLEKKKQTKSTSH